MLNFLLVLIARIKTSLLFKRSFVSLVRKIWEQKKTNVKQKSEMSQSRKKSNNIKKGTREQKMGE